MNWYSKIKVISSSDPIRYIEYNPDLYGWTMMVQFKNDSTNNMQIYHYENVSPFIYEKIEKLRRKKNYPKVMEILRNLSKENTPEEKPAEVKKQTPEKKPFQTKLF